VPSAGFDEILQSWDPSCKNGDDNDFVVGLVAGRIGATTYILDRFKAKVTFLETLAAMQAMMVWYPATSRVLIEDSALAPALVNVLKEKVKGIIAVRPEGSKFQRALAVQPQLEAGQVFLPRPRDASGHIWSERHWVEDFVENCAVFPKGEHDDDVDALTQLLLYPLRPGGLSATEVLRFMTRDEAGPEPDERAEEVDEFRYRGYRRTQF
jgi:predicted phage terminase large subunit-like protein